MGGACPVGIDAGGTKIRIVIGATRNAPAYETAATSDGGPEPLARAIPEALAAARVDPGAASGFAVCAGITKITRGDTGARWEAALGAHFPGCPVRVVPDYVIAFHGAVWEGVGIAVVAGTGSVVYGENAAGAGVRVGGRGWEYGDEGSGTHLTTEMIRRTLRALDGLAAPTPLTRAVCAALGTDEPAALGEAARARSDAEGRGFLVPLALEHALAGEREAADLFTGAAGWLAAYARAAAKRLGLADAADVPVACVGGLWEAGDLLSAPFADVLRRWVPTARVQPPSDPPVIGAARLALRSPVGSL